MVELWCGLGSLVGVCCFGDGGVLVSCVLLVGEKHVTNNQKHEKKQNATKSNHKHSCYCLSFLASCLVILSFWLCVWLFVAFVCFNEFFVLGSVCEAFLFHLCFGGVFVSGVISCIVFFLRFCFCFFFFGGGGGGGFVVPFLLVSGRGWNLWGVLVVFVFCFFCFFLCWLWARGGWGGSLPYLVFRIHELRQ